MPPEQVERYREEWWRLYAWGRISPIEFKAMDLDALPAVMN